MSERDQAPGSGKRHPRNELNDLTGAEWIRFTKSWLVCDSPRFHRNRDTELHPARFPEELVAEFVRFFTKSGGWVLDPFCGSGATLVACREQGRNAVGIELAARYAEVTRRRLEQGELLSTALVIHGDARQVACPDLWRDLSSTGVSPALFPVGAELHAPPGGGCRGGSGRAAAPVAADSGAGGADSGTGVSPVFEDRAGEDPAAPDGAATHAAPPVGADVAPSMSRACPEPVEGGNFRPLPQFDFIITSPPYWDMLHHPRGGVKSQHQRRLEQGLDGVYSPDPADLGNFTDYDQFLEELGQIFDSCAQVLKPGKYLVVVAQNLRTPAGEVAPLAWDLARRISRSFSFQGERIWCQNSKPLGIWGYPTVFVPNYHHHYCLIFRHDRAPEADR